ncbi:MAG: VWA domain-containing protein [Caldilineaceae bacterium]|nr:VWA domain-containing protein [Caldilineaceae bacterium]
MLSVITSYAAQAAITSTNATLTSGGTISGGGTTTTIAPDASLTLNVQVARSGSSSNSWGSTQLQWSPSAGLPTCDSDPSSTITVPSGGSSSNVTISAPSTPGTYSLQVRARGHNNNCSGDGSSGDWSQVLTINVVSPLQGTTATIAGQTEYTAFPGERLAVDMLVDYVNGGDWESTQYDFDGGNFDYCTNVPNFDNNQNSGTNSAAVNVYAPYAPGDYILSVRPRSSNNCSGITGETATITLHVEASPYVANPNLAPSCGLNVILVLDESGSVSGYQDHVRDATLDFLGGLENTGSQVALIEFNTTARRIFDYTAANSTLTTNVGKYFAGESNPWNASYSPNSYTNWDDALEQVRLLASAPLVVFITDGDPTAYNATDGSTPLSGNPNYVTQPNYINLAIQESYAIKSAGSHILAIGVGAAVAGQGSAASQARLKQISDNDVYANGPLDLSTTDLMLVPIFADLRTALQNVTSALCESAVKITKLVDESDGNGPQAAEGWDFSALVHSPEADGTAFAWKKPIPNANPAQSVPASTDEDGVLGFQWKPNNKDNSSNITITEVQKPGYLLESVVCTQSDVEVLNLDNPAGNSFSLSGIVAGGFVDCVVTNKFEVVTGIHVVKEVSVDNGLTWHDANTAATAPALLQSGPAPKFRYTVTNIGNVPLSSVGVTDNTNLTLSGPTGDANNDGILQTSETWVYLATGTWGADLQTNTATATGSYKGAPATDSDDANYFGAAPSINVVKQVSIDNGSSWDDANTAPGPFLAEGTSPQFKFVVTNDGNVDLTNISLTDSDFGLASCVIPATLAVDGSFECIITASWAAGQHTNTATATGSYNSSSTSDNDDANYFGADPGIHVVKEVSVDNGSTWVDANTAATAPSLLANGPAPKFRYTVTNMGNVALFNVTVVDDTGLTLSAPTGDTNTDGILQTSETWVYLATGTWGAGLQTNTATVTGSYNGAPTSDTDDANYYGADPSIQVVKQVSVDGGVTWDDANSAPGPLLVEGTSPQFKFVVTNNGNVDLSGITLTDSDFALASCVIPTTLAVDDSFECIITASWATGQHTNTATATGSYNGASASDTDDANYFGADPAIDIIKTGTLDLGADGIATPGDTINYTFRVENTGNVTLDNVTVNDAKAGVVNCLIGTMAPGAVDDVSCSGSYSLIQSDINDGQVDNQAFVAGEAPGGDPADPADDITDNDTETKNIVQHPVIAIDKTPATQQVQAYGTASFTLKVTNGGNVPLSNVVVNDSQCSAAPAPTIGTAPYNVGDTNNDGLLDIGEEWTYTCAINDVGTSDITNTATADGKAPNGNDAPQAQDSAQVDVVVTPVIAIDKTPDTQQVQPYGTANFALKVTNQGNVPLSSIVVADNQCSAAPVPTLAQASIYNVGDTDSDGLLDAGEEWLYTCAINNVGTVDITNTATADGKDPNGGNAPQAQDSAQVDVVVNPAIAIDKTPDTQQVQAYGTANFTLKVTNLGNVPLSNVQVTDLRCDAAPVATLGVDNIHNTGDSNTDGLLDNGEEWLYTCAIANVGTVDFDNTATADADDPNGVPVPQDEDTAQVVVLVNPVIIIDKTPDTQQVQAYGTAGFTLKVTNGGNVPLSDIVVNDNQCSAPPVATLSVDNLHNVGDADGDGLLDSGEEWLYTCAINNVGTVDITNTATADGKDPNGNNAPQAQDSAQVQVIVNAAIAIDKTPDTQQVQAYGTANFTLKVTNQGNVPLSNVQVTDLQCDAAPVATLGVDNTHNIGDSNTDSKLDLSETWTYTCAIANVGTVDFDNVATADGEDPNGNDAPQAQDSAEVIVVVNPVIAIAKSPATQQVQPYSTANFTLTVTNGGNVPLSNVVVTDNQCSAPPVPTLGVDNIHNRGDSDNDGLLDVGEAWLYTCAIDNVGTADITNTATADGKDPNGGNAPQAQDSAQVDVVVNPALAISKRAEQSSYSQVGEVITYTIVATNTGNVMLTNVTITDPKLSDMTCVVSQPIQPLSIQVAVVEFNLWPNEILTCQGTYTVTQADLDAGKVDNTATADSNETDPVTDDESVPAIQSPALSIVKEGDAGPVALGGTVHYTITVKNIGNVTLHNVTVTDAKLGLVQNIGTLPVNASAQLTGSYGPVSQADLPGPIFNTAGATGTTTTGEPPVPVTDTHELPIAISPRLTLVKTAATATYSVVGDTISYSYKLTNDGNVTLNGPFTVSDDKATVVCPAEPASLATGESITCTATYVITAQDIANGSVTNIATGHAQDPQGNDVASNEDTETVTYDALPASLGNKVWIDANNNGIQDADEQGISGVKVDLYRVADAETVSAAATDTPLAVTTTDSEGTYAFTGLAAGTYYAEFVAPQGYAFTKHNVNDNTQDAVDSDPLVPELVVSASDGGVEAEFGGLLTYTLFYTNSDPLLAASNVVISTTVPAGTTYVAEGSSAGWTCTNGDNAGGVCTLTLATLDAKSSGSATFVVKLKESGSDVPDVLDLPVYVTQGTIGRTALVTLAAGDNNLDLDAGLKRITEAARVNTPTPTDTTNLPPTEQPTDQPNTRQFMFLPTLKSNDANVQSSSTND